MAKRLDARSAMRAGISSERSIFDRQQHRFQRFGKLRDAVESNDRQCALHLMQCVRLKRDLRQVALTGLWRLSRTAKRA